MNQASQSTRCARCARCALFTLCVSAALTALELSAQDPPQALPAETPANAYPDGITPSDVFDQAELLDRRLDRLMTAWSERQFSDGPWDDKQLPHKVDVDLQPMHVYQVMLVCSWRMQQLTDHPELGTRPMPTLASNPRRYAPRDVQLLVQLMLDCVQRIGDHLDIQDMPTDVKGHVDKTPTDVFHVGVRVFTKISALLGAPELRPSEVLAEMRRATADVRSILRQSDPACRYRIDRPENELPREPVDVFQRCLEIRKLINVHALELNLKPTPLPVLSKQSQIRPRDVFMQTQIIIAELNLLKLRTKTISSTPLPIPTPASTTPSDVYQETLMLEYLLKQVNQK